MTARLNYDYPGVYVPNPSQALLHSACYLPELGFNEVLFRRYDNPEDGVYYAVEKLREFNLADQEDPMQAGMDERWVDHEFTLWLGLDVYGDDDDLGEDLTNEFPNGEFPFDPPKPGLSGHLVDTLRVKSNWPWPENPAHVLADITGLPRDHEKIAPLAAYCDETLPDLPPAPRSLWPEGEM